ncbi:MAG: LptF/LptG family permease [Myxococcota bacterium]|nr:LptF/LptG family permease [Myxococcota bacterium]
MNSSNARLPVVRTLSRYFIVRYLSFFVAILVISTLTITLVEVFVNIDDSFRTDVGESSLLEYLLIRVPSYYLRDLLPVSAFAAAFFSVAISVQRSEWLAAQAAGIPAWRMVLPLTAAGLGVAALAFLIGEAFLTKATYRYASYQKTDIGDRIFEANRYWHRSGDDLYWIAGAHPDRGSLSEAQIFRRSPKGRLLSVTYMNKVQIDPDGSWRSKNATLREFDPEHPEAPPITKRGLTLDLPPMSEGLDWLIFSEPKALTVPELAHHIEHNAEREGIRSQKMRRQLEAVLHHRLSDPLIIVMLTLIAIPFALRVQPGGNMVWPAVLGLASVTGFFFLRSLLQELILKGVLPPALATWFLPALITIGTLIALSRSSQPR